MQIKQSFLLLAHKSSVINLTVCFRHRCSARISQRSSQHGNYESSLIITIAIIFILNLQRVQNCLARVVTRSPRFSHSVPLLRSLHWLPVVLFLRSAQLPIKHFHLSNQHIHIHCSLMPRLLRSSNSKLLFCSQW